MNEHTGAARDAAYPAPLADNGYVKQLFGILRDNGCDATGFAALLVHVSEMESFVKRAESAISEMKSQLDGLKELQRRPIKSALQNAVKSLERKVSEVRERLGELKASIVRGSESAIRAFKEKGVSALNSIASRLGVKKSLRGWSESVDGIIRADDKAVAKIKAFAGEYHQAGASVRNMARLLTGKEPVDAKKEAGRLAKTLAAPYRAQRAAAVGLRKSLSKAISSLERLEKREQPRQPVRVAIKKSSLIGRLHENMELVEQRKREMPVRERAKRKSVEL
jgi:uncharacterized protein YukE